MASRSLSFSLEICYNSLMNTKIMEALEFAKVKNQFEPYLQTEIAQEELRDLLPDTNREKIERAFAEIADMEAIFVEYHGFSIGSIKSLAEPLRRLELEADLNVDELLAIKKVLQVSAEVGRFYENLENVQLTALQRLFENLEAFPKLQGSLQAINDGGFIEDFASPSLGKIRQRIHQGEDQVRQILQNLVKSKSDMLAENLIASRNGRSVLPVRNTYRNKIAGVVHDISASGTTVYIEPRAVVQLNEDITQARADERHELHRILRELSDLLRPHTQTIRNNAWLIGHLDVVRAKYLYMQEYQASLPSLSEDKTVNLLNVRHPLLINPIANDLHFSKNLSVIVITGPNTGGKTIMLKTLGLSQIMAQSGLPILADPGSKVAIFKEIFADIGDEQSIEQSLSTFSSHMGHIVDILKRADEQSLVLLDELGAGTDPQEGASLAMAILGHLRLSDIKTMATTHYPELKAYGIETAHVQNASMAFDIDSLRPTYHFMQGVPGRSNAFEIARRLGLAKVIVDDAEQMTNRESDTNVIIEQLEAQTAESRKRLDHIRDVEQENLKFNRAVKKLYNEFSHAYDKELAKAQAEIRQLVSQATDESNQILKHLKDRSQLKPHEVIEAKGKLKKLAPSEDLSKNKVLRKAKKQKAARAPKVGDDVIVIAYGQRGTLINQLKDGRWEAQVGLIKMTLKEAEFNLVKHQESQKARKKKQVNVVKRSASTGHGTARPFGSPR